MRCYYFIWDGEEGKNKDKKRDDSITECPDDPKWSVTGNKGVLRALEFHIILKSTVSFQLLPARSRVVTQGGG